MFKSSSMTHHGAVTTTGRNITLDDYDSLPDSTYRDKIEDVVVRATNSEHIQALLVPRGPFWPMDIFSAARTAIENDPEASQTAIYFTAVSSVLCRAIGSLRGSPPAPAPAPLPCTSEATAEERRAMQKRIVANLHRCPGQALRVQLLKHMHLKWTIAMRSGRSGSGYASDETDEDELELVTRRIAPTKSSNNVEALHSSHGQKLVSPRSLRSGRSRGKQRTLPSELILDPGEFGEMGEVVRSHRALDDEIERMHIWERRQRGYMSSETDTGSVTATKSGRPFEGCRETRARYHWSPLLLKCKDLRARDAPAPTLRFERLDRALAHERRDLPRCPELEAFMETFGGWIQREVQVRAVSLCGLGIRAECEVVKESWAGERMKAPVAEIQILQSLLGREEVVQGKFDPMAIQGNPALATVVQQRVASRFDTILAALTLLGPSSPDIPIWEPCSQIRMSGEDGPGWARMGRDYLLHQVKEKLHLVKKMAYTPQGSTKAPHTHTKNRLWSTKNRSSAVAKQL
ncbi:hypothetical protein C8F04DRAFT_1241220 [Mycena alexandri]|uniref:Uncharacterized protein n=1 Tax=Mycena alexandri TaxID=1745969 RepID=A0AAD6S648_9AGAR|nr:hypothetical protein C8F04DRAFT_1241220 [Mycena alexandri]